MFPHRNLGRIDDFLFLERAVLFMQLLQYVNFITDL